VGLTLSLMLHQAEIHLRLRADRKVRTRDAIKAINRED
jgi:hypothetical protein